MQGAIIVVICIIGAIAWGIHAGRKRCDAMTLLAEKLGLDFSHERNYRLAGRYSFPGKLRKGDNQYAYNIMTGEFQEHQIAVFDYHYETYSPDAKGRRQAHHHRFSFFILTLEACFPELTIARKGFIPELSPAADCDGIDLGPHEFSKKLAVQSKDKKFAYDFCNARMIDYLLGHPDINIEVGQNTLALGFGSRLMVEEIEPRLKQLVKIRSFMPGDLFDVDPAAREAPGMKLET